MLKTNYLGLELDNPVIVAAGPWNRDGQRLRESIASGAGAVVTESIVSDHMVGRRFRELGKETLRNIRRTQIFLVEIKSDITCLALVLNGT